MRWADAVPNLLIGLREGLEAGLVVSILLAALRKTGSADRRVTTAPVWLGVLGAVTLAGSFAAVLTFSAGVLSSRAQQAVGGLLSVLAVGLVTAMVFWMRRTAASLSGHLRGEVEHAAAVGAGALAMTAFLAVGREGLETTLFLWTAVRASGSTLAPLVGAALGLVAAVVLCWLLYRRAVRLNLGVFFARTAIALIVIAAGVLSYGLGDLQDAGLLSGQRWVAFDLSAHVDPNAWWVSLLTGVTELSPRMTVLQVLAWLAYLAVVVPAFVRAGRPAAATSAAPSPAPRDVRATPAVPRLRAAWSRTSGWSTRLAGRRLWATATVLVLLPAGAAAVAIAALPSAGAAASTAVTVTRSGCARDWKAARPGAQTFQVTNKSGQAGEILLDDASGAIVAEIETLGPGTTADMSATLEGGSYTFRCAMSGHRTTTSAAMQVDGETGTRTAAAVKPVTVPDLTGPNTAYQAYAAADLAGLAAQVAVIRSDLRAGHLAAAKADWLTAQLSWERVGASYDSFGAAGEAVDGLPDGLPDGVRDKHFTGLHRLEYGLWHGQRPAQLLRVVDTLAHDIAAVRRSLTSDDITGDPTNLPLRAHEVLEDALRDHLSGLDDLGAGAGFAETDADAQVTRTVLLELAPLITARAPALLPTAYRRLAVLQSALRGARTADGTWLSPARAPLAIRQGVNGAVGALLESLDSVPDLLEVPPTR